MGSMSPKLCSKITCASRFFFIATAFPVFALWINASPILSIGIPISLLVTGIPTCLIIAIFAPKQALRFLSLLGIVFTIAVMSAIIAKLILGAGLSSDSKTTALKAYLFCFVYATIGFLFASVLHFYRFWSLTDLWHLIQCEVIAVLALPFAVWIFESFASLPNPFQWIALAAVPDLLTFHNILEVGSIWGALWIAVVLILICRRWRISTRQVDRFWLVVWGLVVLPFWVLFWASVAALVTARFPIRPLPITEDSFAIDRKIFDILIEKSGKAPTATSTMEQLGMDELDLVEIRLRLEENFSVELSDDVSIESVPEIRRAIYNAKLPKGTEPWRDYRFKGWIFGLATAAFVAGSFFACWWLEKLLARLLPRHLISTQTSS
jgi:acyl carrier protein